MTRATPLLVSQGFGFDEDEDDMDRLAKDEPPPRSPPPISLSQRATRATPASPRASGPRPPGTSMARRTSVESLSGFGSVSPSAPPSNPRSRVAARQPTASPPRTTQMKIGSSSAGSAAEDKVAASRRRSLERSAVSAQRRRQEVEDKEEARRLKQHAEHLVRLVTSSPTRPRSDSTYSSQKSWPMIHPAPRAPADFALLQSTMAIMRAGGAPSGGGGSNSSGAAIANGGGGAASGDAGGDSSASRHRAVSPSPISRNAPRRASTMFAEGVMHTVEEIEAGGADDGM